MLGRDAHDCLGPCLVHTRDLVQEYKSEFVFFIGDLDHIAVYRVKGVGNIHRDLMGTHNVQWVRKWLILFRLYRSDPCPEELCMDHGFLWDCMRSCTVRAPDVTHVGVPGTCTPSALNVMRAGRRVGMDEKKGMQDRPIPVSSVIRATLCPMRFFLDTRSAEPRKESHAYTICKQISAHLGSSLDPGEIWNEISAIIPDADTRSYEYMENCITRCNEGGPWRHFTDTDVFFQSEKHGLAGNIDKMHEEDPFFSIVRAAPAPPSGIYTSDRLRIFGYMLILNDQTERDVRGGIVEYIPSGIARSCIPGPIDKRRFFRALHDARDIMTGDTPPKPHGIRCRECESRESCRPSGKKLSDIL